MQNELFLPVPDLLYKDLYDWSNPVMRCKLNKVTVSPTKSPRKNGVLVEKLDPEASGSLVNANETNIAMFRYKTTVYAVKEECPHLGGPLHLGEIEEIGKGEVCVRCPWHGWRISLTTGQVLHPTGHADLTTNVFPVKVDDQGRLYVGFNCLSEKYFQVDEVEF